MPNRNTSSYNIPLQTSRGRKSSTLSLENRVKYVEAQVELLTSLYNRLADSNGKGKVEKQITRPLIKYHILKKAVSQSIEAMNRGEKDHTRFIAEALETTRGINDQ